MMLPFKCLADKYCGQLREDEGLDKCHQYFNQVNEIQQKQLKRARNPILHPCLYRRNMKISEIKQMMMMCPAIMFAKRRIIKANGLVNTPSISTGTRMTFYKTGYRRIENMTPEMPVGADQDHYK